jgi:hypothetical protein
LGLTTPQLQAKTNRDVALSEIIIEHLSTLKGKPYWSAKLVGTVNRSEHFDDDTSFGAGYKRRAVVEDRL